MESKRPRLIIDTMIQDIPIGLTGPQIEFLGNIIYDEYLETNSTGVSPGPLSQQKILDCEIYGPYSKKREHMELFATTRIAEKFPGMNWDRFLELTPSETDMLFSIVREVAVSQEREQAEAKKRFDDLKGRADQLAKQGAG